VWGSTLAYGVTGNLPQTEDFILTLWETLQRVWEKPQTLSLPLGHPHIYWVLTKCWALF
jgi:hypothetical protein